MRTAIRWCWMLNKRLYKKLSFVLLLISVPLCVAALTFASAQQSGFVTVVLAQNDPDDAISSAVVEELLSTDSLVCFTTANTPTSAVDAVKNGTADVAWIFPRDMQECIDEFVKNDSSNRAIVQVVLRESTVFTRVSQEKLTAALFKYGVKAQYIQYVRRHLKQFDTLTDAELGEYFENVAISEELFAVENIAGDAVGKNADYMTAPIRGLLAVAIGICAAAATIFYMQDEKRGTFATVRESRRIFVALGCVIIAALNMAMVVWVTLLVSGLAVSLVRELGCLLLYVVCTSVFSLLLKEILRSIRLYASCLPLLVVAMVAICPVFNGMPIWQYALPPTYYIHAVYDTAVIWMMVGYTVLLAVLCLLLERFARKE